MAEVSREVAGVPAGAEAEEVVRLAKLVKLMRAVQARIAAGDRSGEAARFARDFEQRVDRAVAWVLARDAKRQQRLPID